MPCSHMSLLQLKVLPTATEVIQSYGDFFFLKIIDLCILTSFEMEIGVKNTHASR